MTKVFRKTFLFGIFAMLALVANTTVHAEGDSGLLQAMQAKLQKFEDKEAIYKLLLTYGRMLDKEDFVGYSKLFAKDGVWEGGIGSASGPEGIRAMLDKVFSRIERGQFGNSGHIMSDIVIDVDGDTATSWSRWTWFVQGDDGKPQLQRSGHYEDILVREDGEWKFKHRLTVTELPPPDKDADSKLFRTDHRSY